MIINPDLAELLGIILGDGHIHTKYNRITITGSLEDIFYYRNTVIPIFERNFKNINPRLSRRKDKNSYFLEIESKHMFNHFLKLGLKRGKKINVDIPKVVKDNDSLIPYFLRGLFDTDGCLKFSRQNQNKYYYPRIQYCFKPIPFSLNLSELISRLEFNFSS